ncbi:hypothetical protein TNCV_3272871 [Trichonephila clavipes]|nr:hypothetical protein TNCV_3272871 [Trichonephila clavipes]
MHDAQIHSVTWIGVRGFYAVSKSKALLQERWKFIAEKPSLEIQLRYPQYKPQKAFTLQRYLLLPVTNNKGKG